MSPAHLWAATPDDREQDLQNKIRLQEQIGRELKGVEQRSQRLDLPTEQTGDFLEQIQGQMFFVSRIEIESASEVTAVVDVTDILAKYEGRNLGSQDLFALIRELTNRYAQNGFSTTSFGLPAQNMKSGIVRLRVNWGLVEGWLIDGREPATWRERLMVQQAMPGVVGQPLNIFGIDQAIENLNNVAKAARINVEPSSRAGYSRLNILTQKNKLLSASMGMDNSGTASPSNGRTRFTLASSASDLLLGNDTLSFNGSTRRFQDDEMNAEYSAGLSYAFPVGYSQVSLRYNHSYFSRRYDTYNGSYDSRGNSQTYALKLLHTVWRNSTDKLSLFSELERKESENYIENTYLVVNSVPYNSFSLGLQHVTRLFEGSLYNDITWSRGLSIMEGAPASFDENGKAKNFKKVAFNTAWSRPFSTFNGGRADYSLRMGGQYAQESMLAAYKQSLGDEFTVRGFKGSPIYGDRGVFVANTVTFPWRGAGFAVNPFIGLDIGYVDEIATSEAHSIAGVSAGFRAAWSRLNVDISIAKPLHTPKFIAPHTSPYELYVTSTVALW